MHHRLMRGSAVTVDKIWLGAHPKGEPIVWRGRNLEWGGLQHHHADCQDHDEDCCDCEDGRVFWGSYYRQDTGECDVCHEETGIAEFGLWVCIECYLKNHHENCGCALWPVIERLRRV